MYDEARWQRYTVRCNAQLGTVMVTQPDGTVYMHRARFDEGTGRLVAPTLDCAPRRFGQLPSPRAAYDTE